MSIEVYAGKKHKGEADTRDQACLKAEQKAEVAAKNSGFGGTCYDACTYDSCSKKGKGSDQYWSCSTTSANHRGSCEKDPSKIRVYK